MESLDMMHLSLFVGLQLLVISRSVLSLERHSSFGVRGSLAAVHEWPMVNSKYRTAPDPPLTTNAAFLYSPLAAIRLIRSWTRQEYPHSLSYHEINFTQLPPTTRGMSPPTIAAR